MITSSDAMGWEAIHAIAVQIAQSIAVTTSAPRRSARRTQSRGLNTRAKAQLASVLQSLPGALTYLREPILAMAQQDQDLLGSGEADTSLLAAAIEQQASTRPRTFAAADADQLEQWLQTVSTPEDAWAATAWFAQAFLMGYELYGEDQ